MPSAGEVVSDAGIVESITLKNFMCHSLLGPFTFGSNVNFVVGNNGSECKYFTSEGFQIRAQLNVYVKLLFKICCISVYSCHLSVLVKCMLLYLFGDKTPLYLAKFAITF